MYVNSPGLFRSLLNTDLISQSPVSITKSPGLEENCLKNIFSQLFWPISLTCWGYLIGFCSWNWWNSELDTTCQLVLEGSGWGKISNLLDFNFFSIAFVQTTNYLTSKFGSFTPSRKYSSTLNCFQLVFGSRQGSFSLFNYKYSCIPLTPVIRFT